MQFTARIQVTLVNHCLATHGIKEAGRARGIVLVGLVQCGFDIGVLARVEAGYERALLHRVRQVRCDHRIGPISHD